MRESNELVHRRSSPPARCTQMASHFSKVFDTQPLHCTNNLHSLTKSIHCTPVLLGHGAKLHGHRILFCISSTETKKFSLLLRFRKKRVLSNCFPLSRRIEQRCKAGEFSSGCWVSGKENSPAFLEGCANCLQDVQRTAHLELARISLCLFEKEETNIFSQGGTYDQYRRWSCGYPDLFRIGSRAAFVVRRSEK